MPALSTLRAALPSIADLPTPDQVMPQARTENFTVASAILGGLTVRRLQALYGFARLVDDVGDESPGDRDALLDLVERELHRIYVPTDDGPPQHELMRELAQTVRACGLPQGPLSRLIQANRLDQTLTRYESFTQLLDYCQLSAAPVGELVLGIFGAATPARIALSDRICAGLQVVEHLQDIAEDHGRGRIYLPREDRERFGVTEVELDQPVPSPRLTALVAFEATRAHRLLAGGAPLARTLPLRQRLAVAGFIAGGRRALDVLEHGPRRLGLLRAIPRAVAGR